MNTETTAPAPLHVGSRVRVNDPSWYRHGEEGVVVKVNRRTIRVQIGANSADVVVGAPSYFVAL